jgi:1-acyl-sn-glycerol-3-phosphate acyltransferase
MNEMMALRNRLHRIARFLFSSMFGLRVHGHASIPRRGGLIIASNHISELDPPVLGSSIPRAVFFMAKAELFRTRMGAFYLPRIGAFPVNRDSVDTKALRTSLEVLRNGNILVVFPEGTRSTDGKLLPVKAGVGLLAVRSAVPVLPAFIWGTDHPFRALFGRRRFSVSFGKIITADRIAREHAQDGFSKVAESIRTSIEQLGSEFKENVTG